MNQRLYAALVGSAGSLCCLLAACSGSSQVSLSGNIPAQYSHVWVTVQEIDFNQSATAGPTDGGWVAFPLSSPSTIDLVAQNGGNLGSIASGLRIQPGTYSQVRLIPLDSSTPLSSSASYAGALYNSEADYVDSNGMTHQLPLEMLNPIQGMAIQASLKVPIGGISSSALSGASTIGGADTFGGTTDTTGTGFGVGATGTGFGGSTTGTGFGGSTTGTGFGGSTTGTTNQAANSYVVFFDGNTDLVPFTYASGSQGILLSQHASAYDLSRSAGISGQLTLTNITTATSGLPAIQVSAETLSADGTRHEVVSSTSVQADGSFLLYPLPATTSNYGTWYDVVIHGPGIATMIIKQVEVIDCNSNNSNNPFSSSSNSNNPFSSNSNSYSSTICAANSSSNSLFSSNSTNSTGLLSSNSLLPSSSTSPFSSTSTTTMPTSTTGTTNSSAQNVTTIGGTLTPRTATAFTANIAAAAPDSPLPAGARVEFLQTLNREGEVPYVIETSPVDPFNQELFFPQTLSTATIDSGTWSTSNGTVTLVGAAPREGTGTYVVAGTAPSYNGGSLATKVTAPSSGTGPVSVTVPGLSLAAGTSSGTVSVSVKLASAAKYAGGELLLANNGTLVSTASLSSVLTQGGGAVTLTGVPAETPSSLYYVTVRAWNSSGTAHIQSYPNPVDLRGGASGSIELTVN